MSAFQPRAIEECPGWVEWAEGKMSHFSDFHSEHGVCMSRESAIAAAQRLEWKAKRAAELEAESQFRALTALTSPPKTEFIPYDPWTVRPMPQPPFTISTDGTGPDPRGSSPVTVEPSPWKTWAELAKTPDRVVERQCGKASSIPMRVSEIQYHCQNCRFRDVAEEPAPSAWGPLERLKADATKGPHRQILFRNTNGSMSVLHLDECGGVSGAQYAEIPR